MRWIFFSLLAINLLFLLWQALVYDEPERTSPLQLPPAGEQAATIALLHEARDQAEPYDPGELARSLRSAPAEREPGSEEPPASPDAVLWCDALGPFVDREKGDRLAGRLQGLGIDTELRHERVQLAGEYWAYIAPQPSVQAALIMSAELKKQGIDAYLISEGEQRNGLSLGIFSKATAAEYLQRRLQADGITVHIEAKPAAYQRFWVLLTRQDIDSLDTQKLVQIPEFASKNQVTKKVCKAVASAE